MHRFSGQEEYRKFSFGLAQKNHKKLIAQQLDTRLNFLHEIVTDEAEVCKMNISGPTKYSSWRQYRIQNGLSIVEPPITKRIQYYQKQYQNLTEEEIAIRVYGNLRYSFTPIDML